MLREMRGEPAPFAPAVVQLGRGGRRAHRALDAEPPVLTCVPSGKVLLPTGRQ
jgi:hypothetical protein